MLLCMYVCITYIYSYLWDEHTLTHVPNILCGMINPRLCNGIYRRPSNASVVYTAEKIPKNDMCTENEATNEPHALF